jgi:hypothetical protein
MPTRARRDRVGYLLHDRADLVDGQRPWALRVFLEISPAAHSIARKCMPGPASRSRSSRTTFGMLNALAVARLAQKARDRVRSCAAFRAAL